MLENAHLNKNLIIELLLQDMKHKQLLEALYKIGFNSDKHCLDIQSIIAGLMNIAAEPEDWNWYEIYNDFIRQAAISKLTFNDKKLRPLAEKCYEKLSIKIDKITLS